MISVAEARGIRAKYRALKAAAQAKRINDKKEAEKVYKTEIEAEGKEHRKMILAIDTMYWDEIEALRKSEATELRTH